MEAVTHIFTDSPECVWLLFFAVAVLYYLYRTRAGAAQPPPQNNDARVARPRPSLESRMRCLQSGNGPQVNVKRSEPAVEGKQCHQNNIEKLTDTTNQADQMSNRMAQSEQEAPSKEDHAPLEKHHKPPEANATALMSIERRHLAMEASRRRLQEEYNKKAAEQAVNQVKVKEQENLDDWSRHKAGLGDKSKKKSLAELFHQSNKFSSSFSPLNSSETSRWRPSNRRLTSDS